jgi:hypothetical protein
MAARKRKTKMSTQLELQIQYADEMDKNGVDYTFAVGSAFVDSMRNTRYDHTGTAIDELIDNAIEAGANTVSIAFGYEKPGLKSPNAIAIIDNGHGMKPNMIRRAAAWGGTHRHSTEKREGMGRFGFGLPSASVNQGERFKIYSKLRDGDWHCVTVDLDEIRHGRYSPKPGQVQVPEAKPANLPHWVAENVMLSMPGGVLNSGTVVVWEELDRLTWSTTNGLETNLLPHFGMNYRNYLSQTQIIVNGKLVGPVDPLFITPGARFYDENSLRAKSLGSKEVVVKSRKTGEPCTIKVRYAAMPPGFYTADQDGRGFDNARSRIKSLNMGIVVCRMGRQIDVVDRVRVQDGHAGWSSLGRLNSNDDRYWGLEIDFPADLDEEFTIANTKQGVIVSDRIWEQLQKEGVATALKTLRKAYVDAKIELRRPIEEDVKKPRPSEVAAEKGVEHSRPGKVQPFSQEREELAKKNFEEFFRNEAKKRKIPESEAKDQAEEETKARAYKVEFETMPDAPFFRMEQRGPMKVLHVNMAHRFYKDIYANDAATRFMQYALEVVLFSIGDGELDAIGNVSKENFYHVEKIEWSKKMNVMLGELSHYADEAGEAA